MKAVGRIACITLLLLLAASTSVAAQKSKDYAKTLDLSPGDSLSLKTYKGSIHLSSWESNQVEIIATIEAPEDVSDDYARRAVEATRVEVRQSRSGVSIESDYRDVPAERSWFGGKSTVRPFVHYQIRAPRSLDLRIEDYKSDIELYSFEGRIDLDTYKGNVEGRDLIGDLTLETYKGVARLSGVQGGFDIETYKGDIEVDVDQMAEDSRVNTYKGQVTLNFPKSQQARVRAELSKKSDLRSDFDLDRRYRTKYSFDADLNGGGPRLLVKSYKGDIRLKN